jgi:uncharacterized membrane protein
MENFKWHRHPVNQEHHDEIPRSVRIAEAATRAMGSVGFIIAQTVVITVWIALNIVGLVHHWDPYPFILLNLLFSTQAAYAAPLILLAANRQSEKDRKMAEFDYQHNETSLSLLKMLHADAHGKDCSCYDEAVPVSS